MKKETVELWYTGAMLILAASCGSDFVVGEASRTSVIGSCVIVLWFIFNYKKEKKNEISNKG